MLITGLSATSSPSDPSCRPSAPRWSTASTGVVPRSLRSTDSPLTRLATEKPRHRPGLFCACAPGDCHLQAAPERSEGNLRPASLIVRLSSAFTACTYPYFYGLFPMGVTAPQQHSISKRL